MFSTILCTRSFFDAGTVRYIVCGRWLIVFGPNAPKCETISRANETEAAITETFPPFPFDVPQTIQ